ncbi:MAG: 50S ribosomal protein L5 [Candidatus Woesebacteria bacterium]|jgi:large subunit ribosomal protein L5
MTKTNNTPFLKEKYDSKVVDNLMKEFGIKNKLAVPRVEKVVVNMGVGEIAKDKKNLEAAREDLAMITGQTPSTQAAKVSVASFGVRKGMPVGLKVTLRGKRMYDFLYKLISIVLPRFRDFRGVALKSFDKQGNYTLGIPEHIVFPEIDLAKSSPKGLEITIVTNVDNKKQALSLLKGLGMPFEKNDETKATEKSPKK